MTELDKFDYRLLELLQENSRLTGSELSTQVGLSSAACLRRVQRLRETGVIERDVAVVSPKAFGKRSMRIQVADMDEYSEFVERVFHEPYIKRYESLAVLGSLK